MSFRASSENLLPIVTLAFLAGCSYEPMHEVESLIDQHRLVDHGDFYEFKPRGDTASDACLIFYQGGRVEELAYGPYLQQVADAGFTAYLVKSPFDLAILDGDGADDIFKEKNPACTRFLVAGHSLGGVVAAAYVLGKPDYGLLLLAAYPQDSASLVNHRGPVASVSASEDGLTIADKLSATASLLPEHTSWIVIEGGNHAQFGWYGEQDKDGKALIEREVQQRVVVEQTIGMLNILTTQ